MKNIPDNSLYLTIQVNEPEQVALFLTECLDFEVEQSKRGTSDGMPPYHVLTRPDLREYFIITCTEPETIAYNRAVLFTDNCLRDYYKLMANTTKRLGNPVYSSSGLAFDFTDHWGNRFTIQERRDYMEDVVVENREMQGR